MQRWNYGDMLEAIEPGLDQDAPAYMHGDRVITWREAAARSNKLARALRARGAQSGDKVAFYMRNRPEYCETLAACFKGSLTHVNVNYRYTADEVFYIFDNSDATVVVYGSEFRRNIEAIRGRLPLVRTYVEIGDDAPPAFAEAFETLAAEGDGSPLRLHRGEDQLFLYTGGTTGMPKGVIWNQHDIREVGQIAARKLGPVPETLDEYVAFTTANPAAPTLICPPLMHGTGLFTAMANMLAGGAVVTLTDPSFDAREALDAIDRWKPQSMAIVGDPFARPMLEALDAEPGRWDVASMLRITSSGVMWSVEVKRGLLRHMPQCVLSDAFSSSEALGMGVSLMTAEGEIPTAKFAISDRAQVRDEDGRIVPPGSPNPGLLHLGEPNPVGYYKDAEKTAKTFKVIDGMRWSVPGDWCLVEPDGSLTLLGRGSACINTAGEKVFPEEVEEALKTHPSVEDVLVVGLPDPKWGQSVNAVVHLRPGHSLDEQALQAHCRQTLAGYKAPKRVFTGEVNLRAPNGKADYKSAADFARKAAESRQQAASPMTEPAAASA
jgi:3-oxocholest-4-en-26-oate---CoA ligase